MPATGATSPVPEPARHPQAEARLIAAGHDARVLEPSPPAVADAPWFADDPTDPGGVDVVGPTGAAALRWTDWLRRYTEGGEWAAERWLGAYRRLTDPPASYPATREALHRLAVYVLSPARRRANGKIALRWTLGGFGTPFFGDDEQVRVEGGRIVRQRGGRAESVPITTLGAAAAFVLDGPPDRDWASDFDVPPAGDDDAPLPVDPAAARWLGDWYGFAVSVLEELRAEPASTDTSRVQLWVEHFDCAFECLSDDAGRRAGYGASPGDAAIPEPYLYVVPWTFDRVPPSPLWNAQGFRGAIMTFRELAGGSDQREAALAFFRERRTLLGG